MKTYKSFFPVLFCILSFASCTLENEISMPESGNNHVSQKVIISQIDTTKTVDTKKAVHVAQTFSKGQCPSRGTYSQKEIKEVLDIKDDEGKVLFFIINYENDEGFVIVSANQNYIPVLAFSDYGNFKLDDTVNNGLTTWIDHQKDIIGHASSLDEESKRQYRECWSAYNVTTKELQPSRSEDDVLFLISYTISKWRQEGYEVFRYSEIKDTQFFEDLPATFKNAVRNAVDSAHPDYGGRNSNTFILKRRNDHVEKVQSLLHTKWGQWDGFNAFVPDGCPVGCVAVAMGQIMKYHQYPSRYSWSEMDNIYPTSTTAKFLYEIGLNVKMDYSPDGSSSNIDDALAAFTRNYGYSNAKKIDHSDSKIIWELKDKRPVYMRGKDRNGKTGHAWVCDGYSSTNVRNEYAVYILEDTYNSSEPTELSFIHSEEGPLLASSLLYSFNWGWSGSNNGYFYNMKVTVDGKEYDFSKDMAEIINLYPVK